MSQTLSALERDIVPTDPNQLRRVRGRKDSLGKRLTQHWSDYLYIAPTILVMAVVIGYPLVYTISLSFFRDIPRTGDHSLRRNRKL